MNNVYVIAIAGSSCAGKTRTVNAIIESLGNEPVTILSQDSYYIPGNDSTNYDVPESLDFDLMTSHLEKLMQGIPVESPIYKFKNHKRSKKTKTLVPSRILLVEGILIFTQEKLRKLMNLKVFISAYSELAFSRRLKRDVQERNRTIDEVTERYFKDVLPSSKYYVEPSECHADIVLKNNIKDKFIGLKILLDHIRAELNRCN